MYFLFDTYIYCIIDNECTRENRFKKNHDQYER